MRSSVATTGTRANLASLMVGDLAALALFTLVGFASHGELGSTGARMLTTFVPVTLAWAVTAPWLGLYRLDVASSARQLWRPAFACLLVGPLAGLLRSLWLNSVILPVFVLVLIGTAALAVTIWRALWWLVVGRRASNG